MYMYPSNLGVTKKEITIPIVKVGDKIKVIMCRIKPNGLKEFYYENYIIEKIENKTLIFNSYNGVKVSDYGILWENRW